MTPFLGTLLFKIMYITPYIDKKIHGFYEVQSILAKIEPEIESYINASPSRREKKKSWNAPQTRRLLVFGAIWRVQSAKALLDGISKYNLDPHGSYRQMACLAGKVFAEVIQEGFYEWPFDAPDPFDGNIYQS